MKNFFMTLIPIVIMIIFGGYHASNIEKERVNDLKKARNAERVNKELKDLRNALEEYYKLTKTYPELTREGAKDNLSILDFVNEKGEKISFAQIYGKNEIFKTPAGEETEESNEISDVQNFSETSLKGGWSYNFKDRTGEIRLNLPTDAFSQGIVWSEH